jgi:PAS domain S-box-containing protein
MMEKLKLSVLLVEDDALSLFVYSEFIKKLVTDVYTAIDGREGIKVFKKNKPDIIITDIIMPELDGLEMIREIKKSDSQVKVIMISGHSETDYFIRSIDLGVDGYLLKPLDNNKLENKIVELGKNILLGKKVAYTEKKFHDFAALLPQIVFEADLNGKLTFVNKLALEKFDYSNADIKKGLFLKDIISELQNKNLEDIKGIISTGKNFQEEEVVCRSRKGELFPALIYTSGILEDGQLTGIRGVMVDITSRKKMMEELKSLNQELEKKVEERTLRLSNEIKEKEKAERALIKAKEKAEESDQLKGIFLANVSHEIQTPIKAIISFSNLLKSSELTEDRRNELMNIIDSNSDALLNLTNDILDFTRLQSKTVKLYNISFELNLFLEELFPVFESLKSKQLNKDIELKLTLSDQFESLMIHSDPSRLKQVFSNLISNAFKFTRKGFVEYGYTITEESKVRCFVKDTGPGISKKFQQKIFERFSQESNPLNIKKEGAGLGLAITQSLLELLGGDIWLESEIGKGSSFYFELPDIMIRKAERAVEEKHNWKDKQVLIIEDEIEYYIALEEILKNKVKIHYLNDGEQAMEFCRNNKNIDICFYKWTEGGDPGLINDLRKGNPSQAFIALLDENISEPFKKGEVLMTIDKYLSQ